MKYLYFPFLRLKSLVSHGQIASFRLNEMKWCHYPAILQPISKRHRHTYTVVMIRHGESVWNLENRFTGWCDVPLTGHGEADARDAGALIGQRGLKFDVAFTSNLKRAWRTCELVLSESQQTGVDTIRSWKLNERHYGALQGHKKDCPKLIQSFGADKIFEWRRSYHVAPPTLHDASIWRKIDMNSFQLNAQYMDYRFVDRKLYNLIRKNDIRFDNPFAYDADPFDVDPSRSLYPSTESLKDCETRAFGYWKEVIEPRVRAGYRVLIVAHANTIRALVKSMDNISDEKIAQLKIPNGVPLVYALDENLDPVLDVTDDIGFQAKYLVSPRNHKKLMRYERNTQKKLMNLFEFLDKDGDGRISHQCLLTGLSQLQQSGGDNNWNESMSEFEVEEILRALPTVDEFGGITLKSFLDSEATLLPSLSRLRVLT